MPANPPPAQLLPVDTHDLMCAILQHMNNDLMFVAHHMTTVDQARFHQLHTHVRQWLIDAPDAPKAAPSLERGELASLVEALIKAKAWIIEQGMHGPLCALRTGGRGASDVSCSCGRYETVATVMEALHALSASRGGKK